MSAAMIDDEYNVDHVHLRKPKKPKGNEALKDQPSPAEVIGIHGGYPDRVVKHDDAQHMPWYDQHLGFESRNDVIIVFHVADN